jgi:hypothetical protein
MRILIAAMLPALIVAPVWAQPGETISLFNGESLAGWDYHLGQPNVAMADVWQVDGGILKCQGRPAGYIHTLEQYENYKLVVEWRWPGRGGNNGVLVHCTDKGALGVWPKSLEVQLAADNAGDFWVIGTTIELPADDGDPRQRIKGRRHINLTDGTERPLGTWNTMEIECLGDMVTVKVNDVVVNRAIKVSQTKGHIALQSEGTPIEFRKVELTPLEAK